MSKDLKLDDIWDTSDGLDTNITLEKKPKPVKPHALEPSKRFASLKLSTRSPTRQSSLGPLASPSSPDLPKDANAGSRPGLTRSLTLPKVSASESNLNSNAGRSSRIRTEVEMLSLDPVVLENIRRWVLGIAIVEFDLDHGPVLAAVFPDLDLTPEESSNIAFSAFPDSLQFDQGSQNHSFRIREANSRPGSLDSFLYGFSHFTQRRDSQSKRGYEQRSAVILTHHPYPSLFTSLSYVFGPLFETHGTPMLETACHSIAGWPNPTRGSVLELGFLGSVLYLELPPTIDSQQLTDTSSFKEKYDPKLHLLASSPPFYPPPLLLFEASLSHLWSIWECLVLGEPLFIYGSSPVQTSQAVWWFRDLLRPIPLAGDIRPYFTIHDQDNTLIVNKLPPKAGVLLGVTNPLFYKSCSHWPHILSLGRNVKHTAGVNGKSLNALPNPGPAPGWKTSTHKRYISKDRTLLKQLEDACAKGTEQDKLHASLLLRRHFCSRTNEILIPLSRYLNTLIPTPSEVSQSKLGGVIDADTDKRLKLKPFNSDNFFASLKAYGTTLPFRSNSKRNEFYERWLKTRAFGLWLGEQERIVQDVLRERRKEAFEGSNVS
ncbi:hypothetical protein AAF712_007733 [Marasmius tenuissimus]|uniref:UDENN domain-containing protein n=1 Tax=Marasmius tenuissimus TaxID=585030 RepID=A0ABR2ZU60_9AGAR